MKFFFAWFWELGLKGKSSTILSLEEKSRVLGFHSQTSLGFGKIHKNVFLLFSKPSNIDRDWKGKKKRMKSPQGKVRAKEEGGKK